MAEHLYRTSVHAIEGSSALILFVILLLDLQKSVKKTFHMSF